MPVWLQIAVAVLSLVVTIVGATIKITSVLHRLDRHLGRLEIRIGVVEAQNRALLRAFSPIISTLMNAKLMTSEQGSQTLANTFDFGAIADIISKIEPTVNPLSQQDLNRLQSYVERLRQGGVLVPEEAREFYRLSDIITHEYPTNEGAWFLFLIGGILLGMAIADSRN